MRMVIVISSCRYFRQGFDLLLKTLNPEASIFTDVTYVDDIKKAHRDNLARAKAIVVDYGQSDIKALNTLLEVKGKYPNAMVIFITREACFDSTIENILINTAADLTIDCKSSVNKVTQCLSRFTIADQRITIFKNMRWCNIEREKSLTKMESLLLPYIVSGKKNKEISRCVNVTGKTVSHHRRNIYKKFAVNNLTGLYKKFDHSV
ncbi:helix-turn-helix transcriptional regulator [Enterobacter sp. RIT418]|nr:helix-turn-helix transcriptional regulator [Enterobacter sp. RIT 418]